MPCAAIGDVPIALDTVRWQMGEARRLAVVMKADFRLDPLGGGSRPAAWPPRFSLVDVYASKQKGAHVSAVSDRVPWKRNVDVTLLGHARAAFGRPLPKVGLRFSVREGENVLFEKRAQAIGKRATEEGRPEPFVTMPVVYESAYGGPATPANPIGTGDAPGAPMPTIVDKENPWRPAAFGPVASEWPLRQGKLGALQPRDLEGPVMVLPTDFDVSYFQSAPPDQQVPELGPEATLVLQGFHRDRPKVEIRLPAAVPAGAVYGLASEPFPLHLRLDTVHIETQVWVLSLTYRAWVEVPDEATFERLRVAAGLSMNERACLWPERWEDAKEGPVVVQEARPKGQRGSTRDLPSSPSGGPPSLPFGKVRSPFAEPAPPARVKGPGSGLSKTQPIAAATPAVPPDAPSAATWAVPPEAAAPPEAPTAVPPDAPSAATWAVPPEAAAPPEAPPAATWAVPADAPAAATWVAPPAAVVAEKPAGDPYGQAAPWASGADSAEAQAPLKPRPKPRPERKFSLKKGFGNR